MERRRNFRINVPLNQSRAQSLVRLALRRMRQRIRDEIIQVADENPIRPVHTPGPGGDSPQRAREPVAEEEREAAPVQEREADQENGGHEQADRQLADGGGGDGNGQPRD
ncbi:uncharacterized protein LOC124170704 [Ischnura elegans]|uniref:uncharacterized protein LOC124170703 n=1 Tax=Ischnura elegans TaxID=197161 RepID=UPI001ED87944|nr:uncharacterized protein LOC124170703 [Ischnura elegans]XP_046405566.1 uncharacterized protein LOC124170704 [Ischnura elegans]